ncbi:MAG TPA: ABC transporter permease [Candidatus Dormibacteraeota bacterium]|nr:ABC transporter permease [Candidatus Dormibacteraeota bacterium]
MNWQRVWTIALKEYVQFFRDRRTVAVTILMPLIQVVLYGYLSSDVRYQPTIVWDQSQTAQSRELLQAFTNSQYFSIKYYAKNMQDVVHRIEGGDALTGIVIPPNYAKLLHQNKRPQVMVAVDASDATAARTSLSVAQAIGGSVSASMQLKTLHLSGAAVPRVGVDVRTRAWFNPSLRQEVFIVPGVLALVMQFTMTFLSMSTIVRERELGTLEQLIVSPIRSSELMLGKMIPLMTIGYINVTTILLLAVLWFGVPVVGSVLLLYFTVFIFFFTTLGMGTLVSTISKTYIQAMQLIQFFLMPSMLLSGFIFPVAAMPPVLQALSYLVPLTYFLTIVRGVIIKGVGIDFLWPQILLLTLLGLGVFVTAILRFRKRID